MIPTHRFGYVARACMIAAFGVSTFLLAPGALAQNNNSSMGTPTATPTMTWSCDTAGTPATTDGHGTQSTPPSTQASDVEFDQLYIDMMLPHHGSIIALAEAALPRLTDPRLKAMAQNIIDTQSAERAELTGYREAWYGSGTPDMSKQSMKLMMEEMPTMHSSMADMMQEMDPNWQVTTFCAAANPDLAFIEQTIPHHQMAVDGSKDALEKAVHPETKAFAEKVIAGQQAEIDELKQIKAELTGQATPTS